MAKKIFAARNRSGQAERVPRRPGRKPSVGSAEQQHVRDWFVQQPDLTLAEVQRKLLSAAEISQPAANLEASEEIRSATEKKSLHASERDTEANRKRARSLSLASKRSLRKA